MAFFKPGYSKKQKIEALKQFRSKLASVKRSLDLVEDPIEAYYLRKAYQNGLENAYFYTGSLLFDSYEEMLSFYESEGFGEIGDLRDNLVVIWSQECGDSRK